ncbi:Uncharacterized protein DAT39_013059, partial [Clarias magur]
VGWYLWVTAEGVRARGYACIYGPVRLSGTSVSLPLGRLLLSQMRSRGPDDCTAPLPDSPASVYLKCLQPDEK